jgi:putative transposase
MITRRCTQRQFLMRPDPETNNAFLYCLAEAAQRFDIRVLFTMANSNHHHTGIHDPNGNYPAFIEHFHKMFAKSQNCLRGRWENFWSSEQTSVVRLVDPEDVLRKMVYALANPVKDHLVERANQWPGFTALSAILHDRELRAQRPKYFFRDDGVMPPSVSIKFARPAGFEDLTHAQFVALLRDQIRVAEENAAHERAATGRRVLGRAAVLAQRWQDRPQSVEPRRELSPRVAAQNRWSREEALQRNRDFLDRYYPARDRFASGARDVVFPAGTWRLRGFATVRGDDPLDLALAS